jgi:hypothetical protein
LARQMLIPSSVAEVNCHVGTLKSFAAIGQNGRHRKKITRKLSRDYSVAIHLTNQPLTPSRFS